MDRLFRSIIGALWSAPFRLLTIPAIACTMMIAAGGPLTQESLTDPYVLFSGIGVSIGLRFMDNLAVEFAIFPAVMRFFLKAIKHD